MRNKLFILGVLFVFILSTAVFAEEEARVLRFPAIHGDQVVFSYAGDLYSVSSEGGYARKLTNHEGYEAFPRFSHDGKYIAFTGEYDGNREVYVIPSQGGIPKRMTFTPTLGRDDISDRMGPNNIVMGWKHDNTSIVFRSRTREWNSFNGQLYLASLEGGLPEQLPVPRGGFCSFSPDDKKFAYNRIFREFRTWKRYRGGMADDIWIYDLEEKKVTNVTKNPAQDIIPMWSGQKIYFLSDRGENTRMNLYVYDLETQDTRRLTDFADFDIKFPSLGPASIVFENGGYIYCYDLEKEETRKLTVFIADDRPLSREKLVNVSEMVTNYEISPDGKRALFGARGEVFTVPQKYGNTRNLTETPGIHERNSKWSPDGKWIAFISDQSGEDEIYILAQDGAGEPRQITTGADTYKYQIYWSPDSKKIMWSDKRLRLNYVDIDSKEIVEVDKAKIWEFGDYVWSPDSQWIAYSRPEAESMTKIYLYSLEKKESYEVTDGWYSSYSPCFDSKGRYLYFVSDRDFNPIYSRTEWNHAYLSMSRIYLVTLAEDAESPFKPKSDEVSIEKVEKKEEKKGEKKEDSGEKPALKVDTEGLKDRIISLPVSVGDYMSITSVGDSIYYMKRSGMDRRASLALFDLNKRKETVLGQINGYEISHDKKKILVSQNRSYAIVDLPKAKLDIKERLDLSGMETKVDYKKEWHQIFNECWRQMKYFFYAPNMHGVDWEAVRERYEPLADAVSHRADLTYILGEMVGELNVGHTYVGGGDFPHPKRLNMGMLGAQFEKDTKSGYFKVTKILEGENWRDSVRSPLTEIGVDVKEGSYILSIDGKSTIKMDNLYEALVNTAGKQVTLKVNDKPVEKESREVVVVPIRDEHSLYYYNWVQSNTEKVNKATAGKVGYIHVPDMGPQGLNEFVKHFYPQLRKKALIIDVRSNGGGNVSPMLIERLRREIAMVSMSRNTIPSPDPDAVMLGPKVCLMDEFSASDGDIFPYRFKKYGLGKLIGKRTWGGVVGIRGSLPLLDGGSLTKPEFAIYNLKGEWIVEGRGVEPDIYVDNDPVKEYAGIDQQLDKAIEVILEELKKDGVELPDIPPYPDKKKKK
ncbi:MAG: PD40 domain-containing protein [Candidatus Aminicenantes bacterium]|nr:PD40 domain-containing protein [Candidatus Aminicenantes bacterium]